MNRKAIQLAISTLILLAIGIIVLIALILALTGGFDRFKDTTDPYLDTSQAIAVKDACTFACQADNAAAFCCAQHNLNDEVLSCDDSRLQVGCEIDCTDVCP